MPGQFVRAFCLARLGVGHGLTGRARRDGGGEGGQELRAGLLQVPAGAGVVVSRSASEQGFGGTARVVGLPVRVVPGLIAAVSVMSGPAGSASAR